MSPVRFILILLLLLILSTPADLGSVHFESGRHRQRGPKRKSKIKSTRKSKGKCPTESFVANFVANFVENGRKSTKFATKEPNSPLVGQAQDRACPTESLSKTSSKMAEIRQRNRR